VYFSSGSTFYNSYPVTADAACVKYFKGMDTVISGSGNAFQEPRQAITAEYLWNPDSPYSFELPDSASGKDFIPFYHDLRYARILPNEIFGENGLLERACSVLYGTEAGKLVAENHKPSPLPGLEPEPIEARGAVKTISVAPVFPLCNHILPGNYFSIFNKFRKIYWREGLTFSEIDYVERCLKILPAAIGLTRKAADRFAKSVPLCDSALPLCPEARGKHLERMSETCKSGVALAGFTFRWLEIFIDAYGVAVCGGSGLEALKKRAEALLGDVETSAVFFREATGKAVDPVKADSGYGFETCEYIMRDLKNIVYTLKTGKFKKVEKQPWW
jgi:hypothetical protein